MTLNATALGMSQFHNSSQSRPSTRGGDYVWQYEYYDDEPVSFEGLKAHRYSIVIGFWVGLAVFVIFMFFVLTLLTKTGAPHPENPEPFAKRHRLGNCVVDMGCPQAFSRPLLDESRSLFHFYINEEEQGGARAGALIGPGRQAGRRSGGAGDSAGASLQGAEEGQKEYREERFLSHFNIPNFVNSTVGDDDLLLCEPPIIMDGESRAPSIQRILS